MSESEKSSNEEYEVESILNKRVLDGKLQYIVKWKGYSKNEATWEPLFNLKDARPIIEAYELAASKK